MDSLIMRSINSLIRWNQVAKFSNTACFLNSLLLGAPFRSQFSYSSRQTFTFLVSKSSYLHQLILHYLKKKEDFKRDLLRLVALGAFRQCALATDNIGQQTSLALKFQATLEYNTISGQSSLFNNLSTIFLDKQKKNFVPNIGL